MNVRVWDSARTELCLRAVAETRVYGSGKVNTRDSALTAVQPEADFECISVLMEHTQDVKAIAWHPHEEVSVILNFTDRLDSGFGIL